MIIWPTHGSQEVLATVSTALFRDIKAFACHTRRYMLAARPLACQTRHTQAAHVFVVRSCLHCCLGTERFSFAANKVSTQGCRCW